jgi:hypothetical protein
VVAVVGSFFFSRNSTNAFGRWASAVCCTFVVNAFPTDFFWDAARFRATTTRGLALRPARFTPRVASRGRGLARTLGRTPSRAGEPREAAEDPEPTSATRASPVGDLNATAAALVADRGEGSAARESSVRESPPRPFGRLLDARWSTWRSTPSPSSPRSPRSRFRARRTTRRPPRARGRRVREPRSRTRARPAHRRFVARGHLRVRGDVPHPGDVRGFPAQRVPRARRRAVGTRSGDEGRQDLAQQDLARVGAHGPGAGSVRLVRGRSRRRRDGRRGERAVPRLSRERGRAVRGFRHVRRERQLQAPPRGRTRGG